MKHLAGLEEWDGTVAVDRPDGTEAKPKVHHGIIASGEKVIADAAARDHIAAGHRKIIAIAMEEYGFSRAISQNPERVQHLVIRGICDDGTPTKDDRWHEYAAATAAAFAKLCARTRAGRAIVTKGITPFAAVIDHQSFPRELLERRYPQMVEELRRRGVPV